MTKAIPIMLLASLLACHKCKPETIAVPAPPPPIIAEPPLRVDQLRDDAGWIDITEAYKLALADWVLYAKKLEILLWGKVQPAPTEPPKTGDGK